MTGQEADRQLALFGLGQPSSTSVAPPPVIRIAGRVLQPTVVLGTFQSAGRL